MLPLESAAWLQRKFLKARTDAFGQLISRRPTGQGSQPRHISDERGDFMRAAGQIAKPEQLTRNGHLVGYGFSKVPYRHTMAGAQIDDVLCGSLALDHGVSNSQKSGGDIVHVEKVADLPAVRQLDAPTPLQSGNQRRQQ